MTNVKKNSSAVIRFIDILFSLVCLILLLPLYITVILVLFSESKNPFFFQERIGRFQKKFQLVKFRTMRVGTKSISTHLSNIKNITYIGKFLRLNKIDEFPQMYNVLIGDMSLVGPRPCLASQKKLIKERKVRGLFKYRPGITGLAQVSGINMSRPLLLAKTDLKMIKQMNLFYYFYYIFKTVLLIFRKRV